MNLCPETVHLCVKRGDTASWTYTIKEDGQPKDITGWSYKLTVDPSSEPVDASKNLFSLAGVIAVGTDGKIKFQMSLVQADNVGKNFYELQQTDAATDVRTLLEGEYVFVQDVAK